MGLVVFGRDDWYYFSLFDIEGIQCVKFMEFIKKYIIMEVYFVMMVKW